MSEPLLISDGRAMGLVDENATLTWLVAPRIDQPTIISRLIDDERGGGVELIFPDSETVAHRHREGTLIVETDLKSPTGLVRVIDCMMVPTRGPVQAAHPGMFIRQVVVLEGEVEIGMVTRLRYAYGRNAPRWRTEGRKVIGYGPGLTIELQSEVRLRGYGVDLGGTTTLAEGDRRIMALRWQDPSAVLAHVGSRLRSRHAGDHAEGDDVPPHRRHGALGHHLIRRWPEGRWTPGVDGRPAPRSDRVQ